MNTTENILLDQVDDGYNYFGYRIFELKEDDQVYIHAFMRYIEHLECRTKELNEQVQKLKHKTMKVKTTEQRGGGYINEVSVAKSRAIKTPLHLYSEWNIKVNKCNSLEEIQTLLKKDKNN